MKKAISTILGLMLLAVLAVFASASTDGYINDSFDIVDVEVNGVDMSSSTLLYVERGETLNIRTELFSANGAQDVRLKAEIGGYEYEDLEEVSSMFDMIAGTIMTKNLRIDLPEDMDASETYTLRLKLYDRNEDVIKTYDLRIEEKRHLLNIQDVIFTPGLNVNSNEPLFITVRVENMADRKEEDIKVSASIPTLGIEQVTYIDELSAYEADSDDDETSKSSDALYLSLANANQGTYDLIIKVTYDNGHQSVLEDYQLVIGNAGTGNLVVSVAEQAQSVEIGSGAVYKVSVANLGNNEAILTAEVSGLGDFANYRVDPATVNVQPNSEGEMFVYVSPKEIGQRSFTVTVKQNGNVVETFNLNLNAQEAKSQWGNALNGLAIGFLVLLIILVVLGIVLAATKMSRKEDSEEPLGESYY